jgi:predicted MFS family arabinose efflux permease
MNDAVGAPIGSFLAGMGVGFAFGLPVVLFAVAAVLVRRLPLPPVRAPADGPLLAGLRADVREGLRELAGHDVLRRLALVSGASNLGNTAFGAVFVVFVVGPLGLPAETLGWFLAALALGGVAGSLVAGRVLEGFGHATTIKGATVGAIAVYASRGPPRTAG